MRLRDIKQGMRIRDSRDGNLSGCKLSLSPVAEHLLLYTDLQGIRSKYMFIYTEVYKPAWYSKVKSGLFMNPSLIKLQCTYFSDFVPFLNYEVLPYSITIIKLKKKNL